MSIFETATSTFDSDVKVDQPVVLDFWAPWCGPCKALAPHLAKLNEKYGDRLHIAKINIDESPELATRYAVRAVPTLVLLKNGDEEGRLVGTTTNRLNLLIGKWLGDSDTVAACESAADEQATEQPKYPLSSFLNDQAVKAAAVARVCELGESRDPTPSSQLAADGEELEKVLGIPRSVGEALDFLWIQNTIFKYESYNVLRDALASFVDSIPVGSDLSGATKQLEFDILYKSRWAIDRFFAERRQKDVLAAIRALHERELEGEEVTSGTWEELRNRAILIAEIDGTGQKESRALELLARPLAGPRWTSAVALAARLSYDDERQYPNWSESDTEKLTQLHGSFQATVKAELGAVPKKDDENAAEYHAKVEALYKNWVERQSRDDPEFWNRKAQYEACVNETNERAFRDLLTNLRSLLAVKP